MSILVTFGPVDMTREEYLKVGDRLPDPPDGRDYHVCAGDDGALYFVEVWESAEAMDAHNDPWAQCCKGFTAPSVSRTRKRRGTPFAA